MDAYTTVLEGLRADDWGRLRQFEPEGSATFRTWLAVVARRLCHDHLRARYGRTRNGVTSEEHRARARIVDLVGAEVDLERMVSQRPSPVRELLRSELSVALEEAIATLPPEDRLLLVFRFEEGISVKEIRALTSAPSVFHVYRRLKRVLGTLRSELEERGFDGPPE